MEIERKYLIDRLPENLEQYECKHIEQGYLNTDPVVRIRKSNDKYTLTYKGAGLMCREEYNLPLNAEAFAHLKEKIDGILIQKRRYLIPLTDKLTIELDVFEGELAPSACRSRIRDKRRGRTFRPACMVWGGCHIFLQIS